MTTAAPAPAAEPQVVLTRSQAQQILDYLTRQPYKDVYKLVDVLARAPQAHVVSETPTE